MDTRKDKLRVHQVGNLKTVIRERLYLNNERLSGTTLVPTAEGACKPRQTICKTCIIKLLHLLTTFVKDVRRLKSSKKIDKVDSIHHSSFRV